MYETELMREILTSPLAKRMVQEITPRYGNAYAFLWLMQVTGLEWDEMRRWSEEIRAQVVPQTATWTLDWWEQRYGITKDPSLTVEQRRQNIIFKRTNRSPANPAKIERIVSSMTGHAVRVQENTGKNHFTIYISAFPEEINEEAIRAELDNILPARLIYTITCEAYTKNQTYTAGVLRAGKEINLSQL